MRARFTAAALFACLCVTSAAQAAEYNRVNTTASKISFIYRDIFRKSAYSIICYS